MPKKKSPLPSTPKQQQSNFDFAALKAFVEKSIKLAIHKGASAAEASVDGGRGFEIEVRCQEIEKVEYHQSQGFGITVYFGQKKASATTNDFSEKSLEEVVNKACHIAKFLNDDPYVGLAEPALLAREYPDLDLYHPWDISVADAINLAKKCESKAFALDKRITNSESTSLSNVETFHVYGNSLDFIGAYPATSHFLNCTLIAGVADNMQRDYGYTLARDPKDLFSVDKVASEAVSRTVSRLNPRKISTRKSPIIFAPDVARGLFGAFLSAIDGYKLYRKSSFLLNKLGEKIFAKTINIEEKPHLLKALGSTPFDGEGVKCQTRSLVSDGVLKGYILDSYSGRHLNMQTTGNAGGVSNIFVSHGNKDFFALLKTMDRGLLVTEVFGQGANLVTGDYSRAAFGFWVEHGVIQYPVHGITIASNLKDMFQGIVAVGNDIDPRSSLSVGSVLLDNMVISCEGARDN